MSIFRCFKPMVGLNNFLANYISQNKNQSHKGQVPLWGYLSSVGFNGDKYDKEIFKRCGGYANFCIQTI